MKGPVDAQRWKVIVTSFEELLELSEQEREDRLARIGATDPELRRSIEELFRADATADRRLARYELTLPTPSNDPSDDPLGIAGQEVSHFRVIAPLASGGMGVVYRAEDIQLHRPIALKFPLPTHRFDRGGRERFLHEARVAGTLDHPNLCSVYEAGETTDGRVFLAMPLYDGETLKDRVTRDGALPVPVALDIARQIGTGLLAAHQAGIIHRDLKPANVMLLRDGSVKILDFGLAKAKDLSLTTSDTRLGTVSYMAPEQIHGRPVDPRTDLWALGVILYEMLAGRRPFEGDQQVSVIHAIVHTEPPRLSRLRPEIGVEGDNLVRGLMRKQPDQRIASAGEVISTLGAIERGERRPWLRRMLSAQSPPARKAIVILLGLATIALAVWLVYRAGSSPPRRTLAVLQFEEGNETPEDQALARGFSDGIGQELSRVTSLLVPRYLSLLDGPAFSLEAPSITQAIAPAAQLRGTMERSGERIRMEVELIPPEGDRPLWTRSYDRPVAELLDIRRDILRATAQALRVRLSEAERNRLETPPTANPRAYELYLLGRTIELRGSPREIVAGPVPDEVVRRAQALYSRARELDPTFAQARARLAVMHMLSTAYDTTEVRREQARIEAETALRLRPGTPDAHLALAYYWDARQDAAQATRELERAIAAFPQNAELHMGLAYRFVSLSQWEDAVAAVERAMELDPSNPNVPFAAAMYLLRLRRDDQAIHAFDQALALRPDYHMVKVIRGHTYLRSKGAPESLAAAMRTIPLDWDPDGMATFARYSAMRAQRRYAEALAMLDQSHAALSRDGLVYHPHALMRAQLLDDLGDRARAEPHYREAAAVLVDSLAAHPDNASIRVTLALAYAGLDRKQDALAEARRAIAAVPISQRVTSATAFMGIAVEAFARIGEIDAALDLLELLFAMPAGREVTVPYLRLWPGFDPLRNDPRFEALLNRYSL